MRDCLRGYCIKLIDVRTPSLLWAAAFPSQEVIAYIRETSKQADLHAADKVSLTFLSSLHYSFSAL